MKALVVPGVGVIFEDGRILPAQRSSEREGVEFAGSVREVIAAGRPLVERIPGAEIR